MLNTTRAPTSTTSAARISPRLPASNPPTRRIATAAACKQVIWWQALTEQQQKGQQHGENGRSEHIRRRPEPG